MSVRTILRVIALIATLAVASASAAPVSAWSGCGGYITVQWGDTLGSVASNCGTTVDAIRAANPGVGWWLYAGQSLYVPAAASPAAYYPPPSSATTYTVQWGDTLGGIALMYGVSLSGLLSVNPQIMSANLIFPGQVINLPAGAHITSSSYYPTPYSPPPGYYPTPYYPPSSYATPVPSSPYGYLKVTYGHGLLVRTGPGINYGVIETQYSSAIKQSAWQYRKNSLTTDNIGFIWVEITLNPASGYSTGWILARDSIGNYFTFPNLGPRIDPNDP